MKHYHKNPRQITKKQLLELSVDLKELGDLSGITHDLDTDEILTGNQRCEALPGIMSGLIQPEITQRFDTPLDDGTALLGYFIIDNKMYNYRGVKGWDDKKREKANIVANKRGGVWDFDILANSFEVTNLLDWGFDEKELAGFDFGGETKDAEPQTSRADELQEFWKVKTGDLWQIGQHRLICGDCTDPAVVARVMGGERADLGFADPPYNAGVDEWDKDFQWEHDWLIDLCKYVIVTPGISSSHKFMKLTNMPYKWTLAAYISNGYARSAVGFGWWMYAPLFSNESIFKQKPDAIEITLEVGQAKGDHHRGQKPPKFMEWVIELYGENIVLDCFLGSGTTLVACQNLGRRGRGIEISPAYCAVTLQRMADAFPGIEIKRIETVE